MILRAYEQDRMGQNQMRNEISVMRLVLIFLLKHHNSSFLVKLKKMSCQIYQWHHDAQQNDTYYNVY